MRVHRRISLREAPTREYFTGVPAQDARAQAQRNLELPAMEDPGDEDEDENEDEDEDEDENEDDEDDEEDENEDEDDDQDEGE